MSDGGLKHALTDGMKLRDGLYAACDQMNEAIRRLETEFLKLQFGVPAQVLLQTVERRNRYLRWGKDNNAWRLLYVQDFPESGEEDIVPLQSAPRFIRLLALKPENMRCLVVALSDAAAHEARQVTQRVGDVDRFIKELNEEKK